MERFQLKTAISFGNDALAALEELAGQRVMVITDDFLARSGLLGSAICGVASIDLKAEEPGLLEFCRSHGWDFQTRSAAELAKVPGAFTPSPFVRQVTGVDNVCERSAAAVSGGPVLAQKFTAQGVTLAAAGKPLSLTCDWGQQERDERKG